jgi:hypothetical protein
MQDGFRDRILEHGGLAQFPGGAYSTDATAWAALALAVTHGDIECLRGARDRLCRDQQPDGRFALNGLFSQSLWVTPLAILALGRDTAYKVQRDRAAEFLLTISGEHSPRTVDSLVSHDTALRGWPWIDKTHSWIDPTSFAILALTSCGHTSHPRLAEATRMLLDRQLPSGGWNAGVKHVLGVEQRPLPENTATALCALANRSNQEDVSKSIAYLETQLRDIRTPWTLGWGLMALSSWNRRPGNADSWLTEAQSRESTLNPYSTADRALIELARHCRGGIRDLIQG